MSKGEELIEKVKDILKVYLEELCTHDTYPFVCALKETEKGYKEVEQFVVNLVASGYTVSDALFEKEKSLNPNMIND